MDEADLAELIRSDPSCGTVLKTILEDPYIERQTLTEKVAIPQDKLEHALRVLIERLVVLELASQADSSVESRVPKKIYLVNPELEEAVRNAL